MSTIKMYIKKIKNVPVNFFRRNALSDRWVMIMEWPEEKIIYPFIFQHYSSARDELIYRRGNYILWDAFLGISKQPEINFNQAQLYILRLYKEGKL